MAARYTSDFYTRLSERPNMQGGGKFRDFKPCLNSFYEDFCARQEIITFKGNGFDHAATIGTIKRCPCMDTPTDQNAIQQGSPETKQEPIAGNALDLSIRMIG